MTFSVMRLPVKLTRPEYVGGTALSRTLSEGLSGDLSAGERRKRFVYEPFSPNPVPETGGTGGQRVGGNDPGFGRTRPIGLARKTRSVPSGVVPAHAL
jgi:hypothetical protein